MRKQVGILFLTVFIYLVGFGLVIPIIPTWARDFQASPTQIGVLMAVFSFFQFLFAPFWGRLSDRYGRRPVILGCLLGECVSYLLFALSTNLWALFLARAFSGFFGGSISTASAYLSDITPREKRSASMGLIGAAFGLGFIVGPAIGGVLSHYGGPRLCGFVVAGLCLANAVFGFFFLKESLSAPNLSRPGSRWSLLKERLNRPVLGRLYLSQFSAWMAMACMEATLILWMADRFDWGLQQINMGFVAMGLLSAFFQGFLVRKVLPLWGERKTLLTGLPLQALGLVMIPLVPRVEWVAAALTLFVLGNSFTTPSLMGAVSLASSSDEQGLNLGVSQSMASLGRILGPVLGGLLYQMHAPSPFIVSGLWALVALYFVFSLRQSSSRLDPIPGES